MLKAIQPANMPIHGEKVWQTGKCENGFYVYADLGVTIAGDDSIEVFWLSFSRDASCPSATITQRANINNLPSAYFADSESEAVQAFKYYTGLTLK